MAVSIAALAIGAGIAIYGAVKKNQDAKKAANNIRPTYDIPQEEYDSERLAESQAGNGMSASSRQYYQNQADQGLSGTTDAILRGGGDANSIGNAYGNYEKGINSLAVYDDQARMSHLQNLQNSYLRMSADKDKKWQINQYGKWADTAQALAAKQAGDQQTISSGIGIAGQGIGGLASGLSKNAGSISTSGTGSAGQAGAGMFDMAGRQSFNTGQLGTPGNPEYATGADASNNFTNNFGGNDSGTGYGWGWNGMTPTQQ